MNENVLKIIKAIIIIGIVLYMLWYLSTHSTPVTLTDLFTVLGGTLTIVALLINDVRDNVKLLRNDIKDDIKRLEEKIDRWIEKYYNSRKK